MQRHFNEQRFESLCLRHEVSVQFQQYLRQLIEYKVVLILDDSGSMLELTDYKETRWQELLRFVRIVFALTEMIEQSPVDVYFLNRMQGVCVQKLDELELAFQAPPKGFTPTVPALRQALQTPYDASYKGRIIVICTDGEPNDGKGNSCIGELRRVLERERASNDYVTFLACTDDDDAIGYLNKWDVEIPRVDVTDDYQSERREVLRAQGQQFRFSYSDYVVKTLLGAVIPALDKLDERPRYTGVDVDCMGVPNKPRANSGPKNPDCVVS